MSVIYNCVECRSRACVRGGEYASGCPSLDLENIVKDTAVKGAFNPAICKIMAASAAVIRDDDGRLRSRVEETIEFCRQMDYTTIGVAFCIALAKEARILSGQLDDAGYKVVPVCCKVGSVTLENYGVDVEDSRTISACNPIAQAAICNSNNTDINILLGLCVGHDILFTQHISSPTTTLIVKDRVLKHNPIEALRSAEQKVKAL